MKKQGTTRHLLNVVAFILVFIFVVELVPVTAAELLRGALGRPSVCKYGRKPALWIFLRKKRRRHRNQKRMSLGRTRPCGTSIRSITASRTAPMPPASYEEAVHYLKEDGTWQEIDNRMTECGAGDDGFAGAENRENNVKIKFANQSAAHYLYRIKDGAYSIYIGAGQKGALKPNKVWAVVRQNEAVKGTPEGLSVKEAASLKKNIAVVMYPRIWENTDLEYIVNGTSVKENILIREAGGDYTYTFTIKLKKFTPVLNKDGSTA